MESFVEKMQLDDFCKEQIFTLSLKLILIICIVLKSKRGSWRNIHIWNDLCPTTVTTFTRCFRHVLVEVVGELLTCCDVQQCMNDHSMLTFWSTIKKEPTSIQNRKNDDTMYCFLHTLDASYWIPQFGAKPCTSASRHIPSSIILLSAFGTYKPFCV